MQKIDFVNATHPAINDTNLNLMQDNIETAINAQVSGDTLPVGVPLPFAGGTVPDNYLLCDGRAVSRTEYAQLFRVIGTYWGVGDGSTTFNIPDLRGKTFFGYDANQTEFNAIGKTGGEKAHTMTLNELVKHTHGVYYSNTVQQVTSGTSGVGSSGSNVRTTSTGGSQPMPILNPYGTGLWIIKANQTAGVVAQVVNQHSESTTNVYSCNYINSKLSGISAYSSSSGTTGDITLSQSAVNSNYAEIYYRDQENNHGYTKVENPNGKKVQLSIAVTNAGATGMYIKARTISINGTSISNISYGEAEVASGTVSNYNFIYITKVVLHS